MRACCGALRIMFQKRLERRGGCGSWRGCHGAGGGRGRSRCWCCCWLLASSASAFSPRPSPPSAAGRSTGCPSVEGGVGRSVCSSSSSSSAVLLNLLPPPPLTSSVVGGVRP